MIIDCDKILFILQFLIDRFDYQFRLDYFIETKCLINRRTGVFRKFADYY